MATTRVIPFIFFQGNCKEAMLFYQSILGGELTMRTYAEEAHEETPEGWGDKIAYAALESGDTCIRAWDSKIANAEARKIELQVAGNDEQKLREIFDKLCEGGKAKHPLEKQYAGGLTGRLFDKYGLDWMITVENPRQTQ